MYNISIKLLTISILAFLTGCDGFQEEYIPIDLEVADIERFVVMNAEIEEDRRSWIQISYSDDINTAIIEHITWEENADVSIRTSGGAEEKLTYRSKGVYTGSDIYGQVGETYTITVDIGGKLYTSTSTMLPPPGFQDVWVSADKGGDDGKGGSSSTYSEEWIINDPSNERNRYLFEWWNNNIHEIRRDWSIDDNRIVNHNEGLRLHNPTVNVVANNYFVLRATEIDLVTYNYFNMYEKIVRGMVGADSQTPYNPVSNFGEGTIGNFRAVAFSAKTVLTPPPLTATGKEEAVELSFPGNFYFAQYHLYWDTKADVTDKSNKLKDIQTPNQNIKTITFTHTERTTDVSYYYRIQAVDAEGNVSMLSPEVSAKAGKAGTNEDPEVPKNTHAKTTGKGEITLTWDNVTGIDGYVIYWGTKPGISTSSQFITTKSSPYIHTGRTSGQVYYYRIGTYRDKDIFLADEISETAN